MAVMKSTPTVTAERLPANVKPASVEWTAPLTFVLQRDVERMELVLPFISANQLFRLQVVCMLASVTRVGKDLSVILMKFL